jgi:hypothetical protein
MASPRNLHPLPPSRRRSKNGDRRDKPGHGDERVMTAELNTGKAIQPTYIQTPPGAAVTSPRSNRIPIAIIFAVLWAAGMLWRAPVLDARTVIIAVIAGAIVGGLMYWLFDQFSARS